MNKLLLATRLLLRRIPMVVNSQKRSAWQSRMAAGFSSWLSQKRSLPGGPWPTLLSVAILATVLSTALTTQLGYWNHQDPFLYVCFLGFALLSFGLRIGPGKRGESTSMGFLFVIGALPRLDLKEQLLITFLAIVILAVAKRDNDRVEELLRQLLGAGAAVLACQWSYHWGVLTGAGVEEPVRLVIASLSCFAAQHLPVAAAVLLGRPADRQEAWRACAFWSLPYYLMGAALAVLIAFSERFISWQLTAVAALVIAWLYHSLKLYTGRLGREKEMSAQIENLHLRTMEALAMAIEARDHGQASHLRRVQLYSLELGRLLGLAGGELEALRAAAVLHDIGKLAIPEHITSKPGRLTPEEFEKIKIHPIIGAQILERVRFPYPVAPVVMAHHERWDGSGYPKGLREEQIPLAARILAAVDTLDSMTSPRPYRPALALDQAIQAITREAGKAFDPKIVVLIEQHYLAWEMRLDKSLRETPPTPSRTGQFAAVQSLVQKAVEPVPLASINESQQQTNALYELTRELGGSLDLNQTFHSLCSRLKRLAPFGAIVVWIQRGDRLVPLHVAGESCARWVNAVLTPGRGASGWVLTSGQTMVNGDLALEAASALAPSAGPVEGWVLACPLSRAEFQGVLSLYREPAEPFTAEESRVMGVIAPKLAVAIENGLRYQTVASSASTDYLTGLPNAASLYRHLASEIELARALDSTLAVVVCDLDGFKPLNDRFGHLAGNQALRKVGSLLQENCRDYDFAARIGGDEFVLVFAGMKQPDLHARLARLREAVVGVGQAMLGEPVLNVSFGAAFFPDDGSTVEALLKEADRRMYVDKQIRKAGVDDARSSLLGLPRRRPMGA